MLNESCASLINCLVEGRNTVVGATPVAKKKDFDLISYRQMAEDVRRP